VLNGTRRLKLRKPSERAPVKKKARKGVATGLAAARALAARGAAGASGTGYIGGSSAEGPSNEVVFQALREWRKGVAREHGVPAYTVFHDATLLEIARVLPESLNDLRSISGIGATKLERYGQPLI